MKYTTEPDKNGVYWGCIGISTHEKIMNTHHWDYGKGAWFPNEEPEYDEDGKEIMTFKEFLAGPRPTTTLFDLTVSKTFNEARDLLLKKHHDYGPKNISASPGGALNGIRVRMHDKMARVNNLLDNDKEPENESLEDSFMDIANYAIIALLVLRGEWPE